MRLFPIIAATVISLFTLSACATVGETLAETIAGVHRSTLDGRQVVGTNADSDGYATAELTIADKLDQICYDINDSRNVGAVTSVETRRGAVGEAGPAVLALQPGSSRDFANCVNLSEWLEYAFGRNVRACYTCRSKPPPAA